MYNDRKCVLGDVNDGEMVLNDARDMVQRVWDAIPQFYDGIDTDHFQIMPNHIHGIIMVVGAGPCARPDNKQSNDCNGKSYNFYKGQPHNCIGHPLGGCPYGVIVIGCCSSVQNNDNKTTL